MLLNSVPSTAFPFPVSRFPLAKFCASWLKAHRRKISTAPVDWTDARLWEPGSLGAGECVSQMHSEDRWKCCGKGILGVWCLAATSPVPC